MAQKKLPTYILILSEIQVQRALFAALEALWQEEMVDTDMVRHSIGEGKDYADKDDWLESRLVELLP